MEKKSKLKIITILVSLTVLLVSLFSVIYVTCFLNKNEDVVTDLIISNNNITINVGDRIDLKKYYRIEPLNISANVLCLMGNSSFATINSENILIAKNAGLTKIYLKVKSGEDVIEKNINLKIDELPKLPTNLSFKNEIVKLSIGDSGVYNKLTITGEYNVSGEIKYSNPNVCEYNLTTGEIIPLGVGSTTVTVLFKSGTDTISKSFDVEIKSCMKKEIVLSSKGIAKGDSEYGLEMPKNRSKQIKLSYFEDECAVDFVYEVELISNTCGLICETNKTSLTVFVKEVGEAEIKISIKDKDVFVILKVKGV